MSENRWITLLKQHYSSPLSLSFKQFKLGAMLFFLGFVLIYMANTLYQPSLRQELFFLIGLIIGGLGFLIAMLAQVRMLISRMVLFFLSDQNNNQKK